MQSTVSVLARCECPRPIRDVDIAANDGDRSELGGKARNYLRLADVAGVCCTPWITDKASGAASRA
ncbi:hypothetical protein [Martelella sp. AMO21009]